MKEGELLHKWQKTSGLSIGYILDIIGAKSRNTWYEYGKTKRFSPDVVEKLKTIGFDVHNIMYNKSNHSIKHIPQKVAAGKNGVAIPLDQYLEDFDLTKYLKKDDYLTFEVEGDSMEPTFYTGDVLLCSEIDLEEVKMMNSNKFRDNYRFVFYSGGLNKVTVKRVKRLFGNNSLLKYTLYPDNLTMSSYEVQYNDLDRFFVVRAILLSKKMPDVGYFDDIQIIKNEIFKISNVLLSTKQNNLNENNEE